MVAGVDGLSSQAGFAESQQPAEELLVGRESDIDPVLSVVMPTLNEEEGVAACIDATMVSIEALQVPTEILVSDSSTDRTPEIARQRGAIVVKPDRGGYGYAYRYAFERARGDYIVMGDADTTYDFSSIPELLEPVCNGDADLVLGSRLEGEIEDGAMPGLHRYVGNPLLTKFLNLFYDAGVSDAHSGFRVLSRDALETLNARSTGMEFASEMVMDAAVKDLTIEEVPITYHEREGEETLRSFRDGWRHLKFMLVNAPTYLFTAPGTAMLVTGLLVMTLAWSGISVGGVSLGVHSMIAGGLLIIVGYQVTQLGIFACITGTPIRGQADPVATFVTERIRIEHSATIGLLLSGIGVVYAAFLVGQWVVSGFASLPLVTADIMAFMLIVLGLQTVFGSLFLSVISGE